MTVPLGAIAPPRPRRRARDLELAGVGVVSLVTCVVIAAIQTSWVRDWDTAAGAGSLVLVLPPLGLWVFGLVLAVLGWRRRPFRGFWPTEVRADHVRRALLFASLVLSLVGVAVMGRLVIEIVDAVGRSLG